MPAASADEEETPSAATPPSHQEAVLEENVIVADPPARQVEVENLEAATDATDAVMDEASVEPSPTQAPEVSEATDPAASVPALLPVPNSTIMLSTDLRYRSQSQDCPGFQVLHQHLDPSMSMASKQTTPSSIAPGTPTQGKEYLMIGSGAIRSEAITPAFCTIKVASSHISVLTSKQ